MTDSYRFGDLSEEFPGLGFSQSFPGSDVGVEVAVSAREEEIEELGADEYFVQGRDPRMRL